MDQEIRHPPGLSKFEPVAFEDTQPERWEQPRQHRALIMARVALHAREGLSDEQLLALASARRAQVMRGLRPRRMMLGTVLFAAGVAISMIGSGREDLNLLLAGFFVALLGAACGCWLLASGLRPQLGDLARYIREDERPADAAEMAELLSIRLKDAELDRLTAKWWREHGAPIRKRDVALVRAFRYARLREQNR